MSLITLKDLEAAKDRLAAMIATFAAQAARIVALPQIDIELKQGEHYAGVLLDDSGAPSHHVILLSGAAEDVTWDRAKEFAAKAGGELPTRREQALLFANLPAQFEERAYWSSEQHAADSDFAWFQYFSYGDQVSNNKSASLRARAVRRLPI